MATTSLLTAWQRFAKANTRYQQFGQNGDSSTFNGATGCTHAVLQRLVKAKTGRHYTQDQISKIAGYPWPVNNPRDRGMLTPSEVQNVVDHFNLPYKVKYNLSWDEVIEATKRGPVIIGILYGYWPEMIGYKYGGSKADGKPGGFAFRNGKTQLSGFENGYHAVLILGEKLIRGTRRTKANEPNHGSVTRPEKPDFDAVRSTGAERAYYKYSANGRTRFAWVPTQTFRPKGY
jgi:hypothetical protein